MNAAQRLMLKYCNLGESAATQAPRAYGFRFHPVKPDGPRDRERAAPRRRSPQAFFVEVILGAGTGPPEGKRRV
jgi:hypothetical protein